jgi:hypothetical protein
VGGVRAVTRGTRMLILVLAGAFASLSLSCGRDSQGQEASRLDLERKVEEILPRVEGYAALEAKQVPAVSRANQETLEAYLLERLESEFPGDSLDDLALAYELFGLIPDTVDVRQLLVDLMLEQAVGYYDPARDVLFIREDAPPELLDAVVAHELVHALQDQLADLDSLVHAVTRNDARSAIQAAIEGQATVAMFAYQLETPADELPELGPEMGAAMADPATFPRLAAAPAVVRDPLLFAYLGGARYVQRLWRQHPGKPAPLGEWLPESTEQLLHTEKLLERRDSPTLVSLAEPAGGWRLKYAGDLGELETRIYFEEHLGSGPLSVRAAAGWDGDAYAVLVRGADVALAWYTVWDSELDAEEFVDAYRTTFLARFGGAGDQGRLVGDRREARIERLTREGIPAVLVVETGPGVELESPPRLVIEKTGG